MHGVVRAGGETGLAGERSTDIPVAAVGKYSSMVDYPGSQVAANL